MELLSPFASPALNLTRLLELSSEVKGLACLPSPTERNTQQLEKCLTFLDIVLGELAEAPRDASWKNGLYALLSALQGVQDLLRMTAGAGVAASIMTSKFTQHYKAAAEALCKALTGLMPENCGLDEEVIDSIRHLQRRLSQSKFAGDPDEDRAADEVRLQATLLEMGRASQQQGLRNIWSALRPVVKADLPADDLQRSIELLKTRSRDWPASSSAAEQRLLVHVVHALEFQLARQTGVSQNGNSIAPWPSGKAGSSMRTSDDLGKLHLNNETQAQAGPSSRVSPLEQNAQRQRDILRSSSGDSASMTASMPRSMAAGNGPMRSDPMSVDELNTDRSWRSSEGSSTYILTGGSDRGQNLTGGSDRGQNLTGGSDRGYRGRARSPSRANSGGSGPGAALRTGSTEIAEPDGMRVYRTGSGPSDNNRPSLQSMVSGDAPAADWVILNEDLTICKKDDGADFLLGRGAFGKVYKAMLNLVEPVALKLLGTEDEETNPEVQSRAIRELELLRDCRNPHIVQFLGASIYNKQIAIVTELMPLGDLHTALSSRRVTWGPRALRIALDVARGLAFLHRRRIAHLDLKSPNILLGRDYTAKIADVGIARVLTESHMSTVTSTGTFAWAAPELLLGSQVSVFADIYSFGVVLWELVTGEQPKRGQLRPFRVPEEAPEALDKLQSVCMAGEPNQRPDARACVLALQAIIPEMGNPPSSSPFSSNNHSHVPSRQSEHTHAAAHSHRQPEQALTAKRASRDVSQSERQPSMASQASAALPASDAFAGSPFVGSPFAPIPRQSGDSMDLSEVTSQGQEPELDRMSELGSVDEEVRIRIPSTNNPKIDRELRELVQSDSMQRTYSLAERQLGPDATIAVAVMLAHNSCLSRFDFRRNFPEQRGLQKLMAAMQRNRTLVAMDLRDCDLGRQGGKYIADMLRVNTSLQELAVWNTNLRQEGATYILRALHSNGTMQRLDIGNNELGPEVGKEAGEMLKRNTGLVSLDLRNNRLGKAGLQAIAEGVQPNNALRTLKLSNNAATTMFGMGSDIKKAFRQKEKHNGLITSLS